VIYAQDGKFLLFFSTDNATCEELPVTMGSGGALPILSPYGMVSIYIDRWFFRYDITMDLYVI
jgi:hypothetical protein